MDVSDVTAIIIALAGVAGTVTAYLLSKRGQHNDEKQQEAATKIQKRITAFDELESLNDRLSNENSRLRDLATEAETRGDARLAQQARRCRGTLDETVAALASLQAVVLSEIATASAGDAIERAEKHMRDDHSDSTS